MHAGEGKPGRAGRGRCAAALLGGLLLSCLAFAAPAAAAVPAGPPAAAGAAPAGPPPAAVPQSARLAALLRADPVYVTDELPREVPRSMAPDFARLARRTGVPTYVLVLPDQGPAGSTLLGAVHDRLGRDGLYVLLDPLGVVDARAFGVSAPAQDASTVALYSLPYDAGPLRAFQAFADTVALGGARAAQRAQQLEREYGGGSKQVGAFYISAVDRADQSFATGVLLTGLPLLVYGAGRLLRRRTAGHPRRRPGGRAPGRSAVALRKDPRPVGPDRRTRRASRLAVPAAALALAAGVAVTAPLVFDQTRDGAAPAPTRADLSSRLERVSAGLERNPLYLDPESPEPLTADRIAEIDRRIEHFAPGPVYVALVPQLSGDESGGDPQAFLTALHRRLGRNGVYVAADPLRGDIDAAEYGLKLDGDRIAFDLPDSVSFAPEGSGYTGDLRLGRRLDRLMDILDAMPRTTAADHGGPEIRPEPVSDHRLPALYSGDFWPGLAMGVLAAVLLPAVTSGLAAGVRGAVRSAIRRRRRRGDPLRAPAAPTAGYLRRTARQDLDTLARELSAAHLDDTAHAQVWECLDAGLLLAGGDSGRRLGRHPDPADLLAAIVLARAGRAALLGVPFREYCLVNPLHGAAVDSEGLPPAVPGPRKRRAAGAGGRPGPVPMCPFCRAADRDGPGWLAKRALTLPGDGRVRVPYREAAGPLRGADGAVADLIAKAREVAGVQ